MSEVARVVGNLDGESRVGRAVGARCGLPERVLSGLAAVGSLLRVFAQEGDVLELPHALDPARTVPLPDVPSPPLALRGAVDGPVRLRWLDEDDQAVRRWLPRAAAWGLARELGLALDGTRRIAGRGELLAHLAAGGAAASSHGRWVLKADWTAAGRGLLQGGPAAPDEALLARVDGLLERHGPLLFEPWLDGRVACGVAGRVEDDGAVVLRPAHVQHVDARGRFGGLSARPDGAPEALRPDEARGLADVARRVGRRLSADGLRGPFAVDGLVHEVDGERVLHGLVELNPRLSFGHVAHAFAARWGPGRLVMARRDPGGDARPLVRPGPPDEWGSWWLAEGSL